MFRPLCCGAAALFLSPLAQAAQEALPLWELGAVGGVVSTPAYPGAARQSTRALALPFLIYRGKVVRADQSGINARLLNSDVLEADIGLAASLPARSNDVAARAGMPDLGTLLEFGPRLKVRLADPTPTTRLRLDLPLRAVMEMRGGVRHQGYTFEPKLVAEMRDPGGKWNADASAGVVFGDRRINAYFYEVRPAFATPERPAYDAAAGLMLTRVGIYGSRLVNADVRIFGFMRYESYAGAANRASSLMKRSTGASAGFGLAWTLRRSAQPAAGN